MRRRGMSRNCCPCWSAGGATGQACLMPEVPHAGEDHRDALLIAGGDGIGVAFGSAWLHNRGDAGASRFVDVVTEREEGVGRQHAAVDPLAGLLDRNLS